MKIHCKKLFRVCLITTYNINMNKIPHLFETICLNILRAENFVSSSGRPRRADFKEILNCIWIVLRTGMPWRMLQTVNIKTPWNTVFYYFSAWSKCQLFKKAYKFLLKIRQKSRKKDEYHIIDSTFIKNVYGIDCVGRNPTDRGRKATKMSALVNDEGMPISIVFLKANCHDVTNN